MPTPPSVLVLRAVKLPVLGGDTTWASMAAAYDALSAPIQRTLEELTALHDVTGPLVRAIQTGHSVGDLDDVRAAWPPRSHPVVCRHPHTGRKLLYVNANFTTRIEGVSESESRMILDFLFTWVRTPEFHVRYTWRPGDVVIWDNPRDAALRRRRLLRAPDHAQGPDRRRLGSQRVTSPSAAPAPAPDQSSSPRDPGRRDLVPKRLTAHKARHVLDEERAEPLCAQWRVASVVRGEHTVVESPEW